MRNNRKRRPTHPGEILREDVLPAAGLTQDKLARLLGVSRRTVSEILHERRPVTTDMAHRLARAFGTSPEMWLGLQQDVDLWDTHHARRAEYERIKRVSTSKASSPSNVNVTRQLPLTVTLQVPARLPFSWCKR